MAAERGLWAESLRTFKLNWGPVGVYLAFMVVIAFAQDFMTSGSGLAIGQAIAAALLAIPAHLTVLKDVSGLEAMKDKTVNKVLVPFTFRGIGLGILAFLPAVAVFITCMVLGLDTVAGFALAGLVLLFAFAYVFARWGTMLPALVVEDDRTMSGAARRSKFSFAYAFPRLLLSFGLLTLFLVFPMILAVMVFDSGEKFLSDVGGIDLPLVFSVVIANFIGAFQIAMTAVVLSRSYLRAKDTAGEVVVPA